MQTQTTGRMGEVGSENVSEYLRSMFGTKARQSHEAGVLKHRAEAVAAIDAARRQRDAVLPGLRRAENDARVARDAAAKVLEHAAGDAAAAMQACLTATLQCEHVCLQYETALRQSYDSNIDKFRDELQERADRIRRDGITRQEGTAYRTAHGDLRHAETTNAVGVRIVLEHLYGMIQRIDELKLHAFTSDELTAELERQRASIPLDQLQRFN